MEGTGEGGPGVGYFILFLIFLVLLGIFAELYFFGKKTPF
jgi:hypothetical protein